MEVKQRIKETNKRYQVVYDFLFEIKMEEYYDKFEEQGFETVDSVLDITNDDLETVFKVTKLAHRKAILNAIAKEKVSLYKI
jgi:hypothetical protein